MGLIRSIKGRPLGAYFLITYAIIWRGVLAAAGTARFQGQALPAGELGPVMLAMLLGPSAAGLLVTAVAEGRAGLRQLLAGIGSWRVAPRWYSLALVPALPRGGG
jgi:hypothetical protein